MTPGGGEDYLYNGVPVSILNPFWARQQMEGGRSLYDRYKAQGIQFAGELLGGGYGGPGGAWASLAELGAGVPAPDSTPVPGPSGNPFPTGTLGPAQVGQVAPPAQQLPLSDYLAAGAPSMKSALTNQLGPAAPQPKRQNMGFLSFLNAGKPGY